MPNIKKTASTLFGDFGHTVRTLIIGSAAAAVATWGFNTFVKNPVEGIKDAGKTRTELIELKEDYAKHLTREKEWRDKRNAEADARFKVLEADTTQLKVDSAYLKGRTQK